MNRTRHLLPIFAASSMSLLFLAGCPNAGTQPSLPGTGASPTQAPATAQTTPPVSSAGSSETPGTGDNTGAGATSTATNTSQTAPNLGGTTVRGTVYDENGATVDGATVHVVSLDSAASFDSTVTANGGSYVVNGVPAGVQVQITATKATWTSRTRVTSLLPLSSAQPNTIDFGGSNSADNVGHGYFISEYPEIAALSPVSGATLDAGSTLTYKITFSEPLDATNQRRVQDALEITSTASVPSPAGTSITINSGSYFGVDSNTVQMAWDPTGTTLTVTFLAPLYSSSTDDQTYQMRLLRASGASAIEDPAGHDLGYTAPSAGSLYTGLIAEGSPMVSNQTTGAARWTATHADSASFKVAKDAVSPKLKAVAASSVTLNGVLNERFALTFDKPMAVYGTNTAAITGAKTVSAGSVQNSTTAASQYQFVISKTSVSGINVDGTPTVVSSTATANSALSGTSVFTFDTTQAVVQPSTSDPKTIWLEVPSTLVPSDALYFKVEAKNIQDPAGNTVSTASGTSGVSGDNIQSGQF